MRQALNATLKQLQLPESLGQELRIQFSSTIPVAKGMASSTADISATIIATARHFHRTIEDALVATIATSLEPSDSTMFRSLTLFQHQSGEVIQTFPWQPNIDILLLESDATLTTACFHQHNDQYLDTLSHTYQATHRTFELAMREQSPTHLGTATTMSAQFSQHTLPKPAFNSLLNLVEQFDLLGLNVAHSGTIVGLLYHEAKHDIEKVIAEMKLRNLHHDYPHVHHLKMIMGGVK